MNINSAISNGSKILRNNFILSHQLDSEILMAKTIKKDRNYILQSVIPTLSYLPIDNNFTQIVGGVIRKDEPLFFFIEYLSQDHEAVLLLDVMEITSDEYLDLILENNTLEYYANRKD